MTIKTFTFSPFQENTYVLHDETNQAIIIDAGCFNDGEKRTLKIYLEENELILTRLLNTHLHLDHQFGNKFIHQTYGIKPEACEEDEFLLQNVSIQARLFGLAFNETAQEIGSYITDNQEIKFGNTSLKALHVPGHSPGSMAFYSEKDGILFAGDVLFRGSIGRTDLEKGDYATLIRSIQNRLLPLPDSTVVYCGHGPATTIGDERVNNPYL
ncbi:MAG: MBL fold metallo-hydrolase [Bacteroidales bacterium]|nr:MBL fold metallo-hydrolase [Bacteroidales bacterium]